MLAEPHTASSSFAAASEIAPVRIGRLLGCAIALTCAAGFALRSPSLADDGEPYAIAYFGEPIRGLSVEQSQSFDRGYQLFVRNWDNSRVAHNATSCMTCHSVPMPGGAGMSHQALVSVRESEDRTEVLPRLGPGATAPRHASVRRTPPLFGLGLLEHASQRQTSEGARPIFGARQEFGSLEAFVELAFQQELGVTSAAQCARVASMNPDAICSPQITEAELADVVTYIRFLAPPPRRTQQSSRGEVLFSQIGCQSCHVALIDTVSKAPEPLREVSAYAYSDLLSHDLGHGPVRTSPLWGVNSTGPPYMHNAGAQTLSESIAQHGGEASEARAAFVGLSASDRSSLLDYLRGL